MSYWDEASGIGLPYPPVFYAMSGTGQYHVNIYRQPFYYPGPYQQPHYPRPYQQPHYPGPYQVPAMPPMMRPAAIPPFQHIAQVQDYYPEDNQSLPVPRKRTRKVQKVKRRSESLDASTSQTQDVTSTPYMQPCAHPHNTNNIQYPQNLPGLEDVRIIPRSATNAPHPYADSFNTKPRTRKRLYALDVRLATKDAREGAAAVPRRHLLAQLRGVLPPFDMRR